VIVSNLLQRGGKETKAHGSYKKSITVARIASSVSRLRHVLIERDSVSHLLLLRWLHEFAGACRRVWSHCDDALLAFAVAECAWIAFQEADGLRSGIDDCLAFLHGARPGLLQIVGHGGLR